MLSTLFPLSLTHISYSGSALAVSAVFPPKVTEIACDGPEKEKRSLRIYQSETEVEKKGGSTNESGCAAALPF